MKAGRTGCWPRDGTYKELRSSAPVRWVDDIVQTADRMYIWVRIAQDRGEWQKGKEAYAKQWDEMRFFFNVKNADFP